MRAVAYLSHALSLRQASPSPSALPSTAPVPVPVPDNATCNAAVGTPGSVYICPSSGACIWWEYSTVASCRTLEPAFKNPVLVGPDYGGHCHLYNAAGCADANEIQMLDNIASAPLPVPTKPSKIVCPGIRGANVPPDGAVAIKCINSLEHPTPGAAANTTATTTAPALVNYNSTTPAAPTAPSGCPAVPTPSLTRRQSGAPTPDPCSCVAGNGHPGAVYLCKSSAADAATDCKWIDFAQTKTCMPLQDMAGMNFSSPALIGPDYGGHCHIYTTATCTDGTEVWLGTDDASKKIVCPGKGLTESDALAKAVAIKCVDSLEHPTSAVSGAPAASVTAASVPPASVQVANVPAAEATDYTGGGNL